MKREFSIQVILFLLVLLLSFLLASGGFRDASAANNDARFATQSVPTSMVPGQTYLGSVTMQNTGTSTWTSEYRLGSQNPQDNSLWGMGRVYLEPGEAIKPGQSKGFQFNVTAPAFPGIYAFQWRMVREGVEWFGEFTPSAAVTVGDVGSEASPFGVVAAPGIGNDPRRLADLEALGVGWVRVALDWPDMEPSKGNIQWDLSDRIVNEMSSRGIKIYWNFSYAPCWANGRPQKSTGECLNPEDHHYPPLNQSDLYDFVYAVVSRYKDQVRYWGHWNEVNLNDFYKGGSNRVDRFVANELKTTIAAIKAADPTAKVVVGELSSSGNEFPYLKKILDAVRDRFDVISHHVYDGRDTCAGRLSETIDPLRTYLVNWGYADIPLWVTETGLRDSVARKSNYLPCIYGAMKTRPWWTKTFWYRYEFEGTIAKSWGLLDGGPDQYTPNQTYYTYQNYILSTSTPDYVGCFTDDAKRALPVRLSDGGETVESCTQKAASAGYAYAGVQWYGECHAGNTVGYTQMPDAECNTPCNANPSEMCGGAWRNSIYRTGNP